MATTLRMPFPSLSADNLISRGAAGHVFAISETVVFKCPTMFNNPALSQEKEMEESIQKVEREKEVYKRLMQHPHPYIVHGILCVPEGFFMQRLDTTLDLRLRSLLPNSNTQERWIQQLISAVVWLEELGYVHGDLRPGNILLDKMDNIKISDFDATVRQGEELLVASEPFCRLNEDYETFPASSFTEQFSLGSCIYNIRFGHQPFHTLEAPIRVQRMIKGEYPPTSTDSRFGEIILACWRGTYDSIGDIKLHVDRLGRGYDIDARSGAQTRVDCLESWRLLAECKKFVIKERLHAGNGIGRLQARFHYWGQWTLHRFLSVWLEARHRWRTFISMSN